MSILFASILVGLLCGSVRGYSDKGTILEEGVGFTVLARFGVFCGLRGFLL